MRRFRFTVGLDCDDLLFSCIPYAAELANKKYQFDPPITPEEITGWLPCGGRGDVLMEYFTDPEFFQTQPLLPGAKEFVKKLSEIAEVYFITSVPPVCMGIRAMRLKEEFPWIPEDHIYMGHDKERIYTDFLFDDGANNILNASAAYPVLMRRPWNNHVTGVLAVNNYDDFLKIVEVVIDGYREPKRRWNSPAVVALVGPSGSGKTTIAETLEHSCDSVEKPISATTREKRPGETDASYHFITREEFQRKKEMGEFLEHTMYAGNGYGLEASSVEDILKKKKHAVIVTDMCGAIALKSKYPHSITVFVKRSKKERILAILKRNIPEEDKANRILSMAQEDRNEELCDYTLDNNHSKEQSVEELKQIIRTISAVEV